MTPDPSILFALPGNEELTEQLSRKTGVGQGEMTLRQFPDGETYVRVRSEVKDKTVVLVESLYHPDPRFLSLYFLARTVRDLGASRVVLVAPYLAYMRQDKRFHPGEGVTSEYFGPLVSSFVDALVTVDPHLHRKASLADIYEIPYQVVHAAGAIAEWIRKEVERPVLIGPDHESKQWVSEVAEKADAPFMVLKKTRKGDEEVEISVPHVEGYQDHTPVLVDDIISTARTMIGATEHLLQAGMKPPVCIGVHAIFAGEAYRELREAGAGAIVTCNTIPHESNRIDISGLLVENLLPGALIPEG